MNVAIVTGASRGIGRGIALALAQAGMRLVLTARDEPALHAAAREIRQSGGSAEAVAADLRTGGAAEAIVAAGLASFGKIDVLVNNAGATKRGAFQELSDEDWADGFTLKFFGAVRLTRAAWPHLVASRGSVVNIAGVGGRTPGAEFAIGGSVNAAMLSLTKSLADTGIGDGVQVNAVNPGPVRTDRLDRRLSGIATARGIDSAAAAAHMVKEANITRLGEVSDIAALVAFIVSPAGRFLQGALIDMDGGQTKTL